jgi:hypothetical protein
MSYFIVFPSGDRNKISVVEIPPALNYEINDYAVASRKEFFEVEEAVEYAKELAVSNNKEYIGDDDVYLD